MHNESDGARKLLRDLLEYNFYIRLGASGFMLLVFLGYLIYSFAVDKIDTLAIIVAIFFGVILVVTTIIVSSRVVKNGRLKRNYLKSDCYKVTKKPFIKAYRMPYYQYQFEVFDQLNRHQLGDMLFDISPKEQVFDNNDTSIDILLFHNSGIYAIQTLALDGPLKGKADERIWTPYFYLGVKKTVSVDHTLLKSWRRANILVNPIMQTDLYVKNVKKHLQSFDVKGVTIVSEKMIDQTFSSMNNRLFSLNQFMTYLEEQDTIYSESALNEAKSRIIKYIVAA